MSRRDILEVTHFFPSETHDAIPVAARTLEKLKRLTGRGSGNSLRPEEVTALPAISALLACEVVQSKDLDENSAQKLSHTTKQYFRSALSRARQLLQENAEVSPSRSSSKRRSVTNSTSPAPSPSPSNVLTGEQVIAAITPRKTKQLYDSRRSQSLLTPSQYLNTPDKASPLRQSHVRIPSAQQMEDSPIKSGAGADVERTPTKKAKYSNPGIDLEHPPDSYTRSGKRKGESTDAFFSTMATTPAGLKLAAKGSRGVDSEDRMMGADWLKRPTSPKKARTSREKGSRDKKRRKVDWTFQERNENEVSRNDLDDVRHTKETHLLLGN
ncbi:hypothetical protein L202_04769 [Cryptococcus amylolentus CBS 6039]|uniref:Uncharacterized protein n=1 Tax=Cryptococcus amylolentus CBS 6039 TaxID=1295533 RepID=A0A1E3HMQ3_9TREE|nr:hypothetical protein L202_04769 [Cryptococcus amylolentus CBS 6039]ODN77604.1 hypothetical protein L202_04769 [Cryptococcus amylolentus CBS 6039]